MKLIILHHDSDGCTYSCTNTIPVRHDSAEALLCELEDWAKSDAVNYYWKDTEITKETILGEDDYRSVEVMTLDDWFYSNVVGG